MSDSKPFSTPPETAEEQIYFVNFMETFWRHMNTFLSKHCPYRASGCQRSVSDHEGDSGHSFSRRYVKRIFRRKHVKIHCIFIYLHISFVLKNYVSFSTPFIHFLLYLHSTQCPCSTHQAKSSYIRYLFSSDV